MPGYLTVAGIAAVVTFCLTFFMRWVAPRIGAIAMPGPRSVHTKPTPSLGGAAMFAGFRISAGLSVIGALVGDLFFKQGEPGLGIAIDVYRSRLQTEQMYGAVILATGDGVVPWSRFAEMLREKLD